jgi:hypothetical protein
MSDVTVAVIVTALLIAGLSAWGITMHFCCGFAERRRARRNGEARNLRTMR